NVPQSFAIAKASQVITFVIPDHTYLDPDFTATATSSSGLPVKYGRLSGPCTVTSSGVVHITAVGTCTLKATQAGDSNFNSALTQASFAIATAGQAITFPTIPHHAYRDTPLTVRA